MAIWYVDYVNGSNSNNGTSWSNAWKTINNATASNGVQAGDTIRIAKSPDPTPIGNATWTHNSNVITLATAVTANIDLCETNWTAAANVTASLNTSFYTQGNSSVLLVIDSDFTTGKVAHKSFSSIDLSGYRQVSFWIRASATISAGVFTLRLCSDTSGNTTVNTIPIPLIYPNRNYKFTIDNGSALGSSIQSVALYASSDPGIVSVYLDNIIACKAPTANDSLSLTSLISKNSQAQGGQELWYPIESINGTTVVILDKYSGAYYGASETVATHKRETIKTDPLSYSDYIQYVYRSFVNFEGGFNPSNNQQDGTTFFDGVDKNGTGIGFSNVHGNGVNLINAVNYNTGLSFSTVNGYTIGAIGSCNCPINFFEVSASTINSINVACGRVSFTDCERLRINTMNIQFNTDNLLRLYNSKLITIENISGLNGARGGEGSCIYFENSSRNVINYVGSIRYAVTRAIYLVYNSSYNQITADIISNNDTGIWMYFSGENIIRGCTISNTSFEEVRGTGPFNNYFYNVATQKNSIASPLGGYYFFNRYNKTANNHRIYTSGGHVDTPASTAPGGTGIMWRVNITNTVSLVQDNPFTLSIAKVAVAANEQVTVKIWVNKSHATAMQASLVCPAHQLPGINETVVVDVPNSTGWQEVTLNVTPTEAGVLEFLFRAWTNGTSTGTISIDNMTIIQG